MTEVGKTQGYTGCELKKEISEVDEDGDDDGKEEGEDMRDVCFEVKQEKLHEPGDYHAGSDAWCRRNRRWRRG